jgi:alpha-ketoglutarate-dependent taurine dioxygenase
MKIQPLDGATFGATVTDVSLREIDPGGFADLYRAWLDHALLILPEQHFSREEQVAFARRFGGLEIEGVPISNVRADGSLRAPDPNDQVLKTLRGNLFWHADSTYMPVQAKGAVFSAHVVPSHGGETGWADMRAAYDALDPDMKMRVEPLSARHSIHHSQAKVEAMFAETQDAMAGGVAYAGYGAQVSDAPLRPLVKRHPETGRPSLNIGRHAFGIPGMTERASEKLLDELVAFACREPRTHQHAWRAGDVVIWDNRCLLHRGRPWDDAEPRVMYHSRMAGHPLTEYAAPG